MSNFYIGDVVTFIYKGKEYNASIESIKLPIFIIQNLVTGMRSSLTWYKHSNTFWFTANKEEAINLMVTKEVTFPFSDLVMYLKKEVLIQLDHNDFVNLAKTCREMYQLISGRITDDFRLLNGNLDERIYDIRSEQLFEKRILALRNEEPMSRRKFYYRIMKFEIESFETTVDEHIYDAFKAGDLLKLKYFYMGEDPNEPYQFINGYLSVSLTQLCVDHNYIHILNWLFSYGIQIPSSIIKYAIDNDHIEVCKWCEEKGLLTVNTNFPSENYCIHSVKMMEWMIDHGYELSERDVNYSIFDGNLELLKFLVERKISVSEFCIGRCVVIGNLNMLKYLIENEITKINIYNLSYFKVAGQHGHLHIMKYLEEKGVIPTQRTFPWIIRSWKKDHNDILEYYDQKKLIPDIKGLDARRLPGTVRWLSHKFH